MNNSPTTPSCPRGNYGPRLPFHSERLEEALVEFRYSPNPGGLKHAIRDWEGRGDCFPNPHAPTKVFSGKNVAEVTRDDLCRLFHGLAAEGNAQAKHAALLAKMTPDYFVFEYDIEELLREVSHHLCNLSDSYYGSPAKAWLVYSSLPAALKCLARFETRLDEVPVHECISIARLASEWIEAAKLSGKYRHADLECVYWVGRRAAERCAREHRTDSMVVMSMLEHACPVDDEDQRAVSGLIWHRRSLRFDDDRVVASIPKIDRARLNSLHGHRQQENAFSVGQLILRAGLKLSSRDDSRTSDANRDLEEAKGLLEYGTDRTRGYYHLMKHFYHRRLMEGRPRDKTHRSEAENELLQARDYYVGYLGTESHLHVAACDISRAELRPASVKRAKILQGLEIIFAGPHDRSGIADLSGVFDGSSRIYRRVPFDPKVIAARKRCQRERANTMELNN